MPTLEVKGTIEQTDCHVSDPAAADKASTSKMLASLYGQSFGKSTYDAAVDVEESTVTLTEHFEHKCPENHEEHNIQFDHVHTYKVSEANFDLQLFADALVEAEDDVEVASLFLALKLAEADMQAKLEAQQAANQEDLESDEEKQAVNAAP